MIRANTSRGLSLSAALLATVVIGVCAVIATACSQTPFVDEPDAHRGVSETSLSPLESKILVQNELRDTTNLIGGEWELQLAGISYPCTTARGNEGAYYSALMRFVGTPSTTHLTDIADSVAARWKSLGYSIERAAYSDDMRIVMGRNTGGGRLSFDMDPWEILLMNDGPCVPTDYDKLASEDERELERTSTPDPLDP
ncbi:hypothetical protein ACUWEX_02145 [Okibacterium fritillariae]|jgi:hypothetical protein|uniref:Lipoprotein n=1 Tax=Okibacterium fritillariae TaxID=123320 RepID=A0A1T5IGE1_9MICO|nr:hypothetical protein [Okibacterium fritillariae]SKC38138.1 hypothetical protein SAMN06309945_0411 [Okibacterium fritillariae]